MNFSERTVADRNASSAKLLFVLSNDYGELANAMYLLMGHEFQAVLLMPDRLFSINRNTLPAAAHRYSSRRDVTDHVQKERPDIVFLFSGYLYAINNIFGVDAVEALVGDLGQMNLVTSDPFLGILSELGSSTFSDRHPRRQWLVEHFGRLVRVFQGIPHLYLVRTDDFERTPSVSFFNEHIILPPSALTESRRKLTGSLGLDPAQRRWLFVLSLEDYASQAGFRGGPGFDEILIAKLRQATREGRQPVVIAPPVAIASLRDESASIEGVVLLPFCSYDLFMSLLLDAEYVFYWNIFSNSIPARVLNHLPVFFFDAGHMVHAIPPLAEVGLKRYYAGSEPLYLDQEARLVADELALLALRQDQAMQAARESFRRSPPPVGMVERILRNGGRYPST